MPSIATTFAGGLIAAATCILLAHPAAANSLQQRRLVDGCDVGGGSNDIQSIATEYHRAQDRIEVTLRLCAAAKRGMTYRLHVDHAAPFVEEAQGCVDPGEATIVRGPEGHRGKGRSEIAGSTVRFVVPLAELGVASPRQVPVIYLWADSRSGGVVDRAPNREGGDGCDRPQARSETLVQTRLVNGNLIWIGEATFTGQFAEGFNEAFVRCESDARANGLTGPIIPWFSQGTRFPNEFIDPPLVGPLYTTRGTLIATTVADLANCTKGSGTDCLLAPIDQDAAGRPVTPGTLTWTGTQTDGTPAGTPNCNGWLSSLPGVSGDGGVVGAIGAGWTTGSIGPCSAQRRLICLQVPD